MTEQQPTPRYGTVERHRSVAALLWGLAGLALGCWIAIDAAVHLPGRAELVTIGVVAIVAGCVFAAMVRPVLLVDETGLTIRNPLRTIAVPWREVTEIAGGMSVEVRTGTRKYTVWAVPVSLRQRGRAQRRAFLGTGTDSARASTPYGRPRGRPALGLLGPGEPSSAEPEQPWADRVLEDLRDRLREQSAALNGEPPPDGEASSGNATASAPGGEPLVDGPGSVRSPGSVDGGVRVTWVRALPVAVVVGAAFILAGALV